MYRLLLAFIGFGLLAPSANAQPTTLNRYEYWFDEDYASHGFATTSSVNVDIPDLTINTGNLTLGPHTLRIRFRDSQGQWGSVVSRAFIKMWDSSVMTQYEYWFDEDDDDASRVSVAVSGVNVDLPTESIDISDLDPGPHTLRFRFRDSQGQWGSVVSRAFIKTVDAPYQITAVRYWVSEEQDPTDMQYHSFDVPVVSLDIVDELLDACAFPNGTGTLKIQVRDNHAQWSSVITRTLNVTPPGTLAISGIETSGTVCPGEQVTFTATVPSGSALPTSYAWSIPSGAGWDHTPSDHASITVTIGNTAGNIGVTGSNACGSSTPFSLPVTVPATPAQPVMSGTWDLEPCEGALTYAVQPVAGVHYEWTGLLSGSGDVITGNIDTDGTIIVTPYNTCDVAGDPLTASITVQQAPNAGTDGAVSVCSADGAFALLDHLGGSPDAGGTWSGPSTVPGGIFNPATMNAGTYTYMVIGSPTCPAATATVTVTIHTAPDAGTSGALNVCGSGSPVSLFSQLGGSPDAGGTWSGPSPVSGGMFNPATMADGAYMYTVAGTAPCQSASANVTVTITQAPDAGSDNSLTVCDQGAAMSLFAALGGTPDAGGTWSGPSPVTGGIYDPATMDPGGYLYTVNGTAPCGSVSATVTVIETSNPDAGTDGALALCSNGAAVDLFTALGGTPDAGGTWSGGLVGGMFNPAINVTGTYTYTLNAAAPCQSASAEVDVTITQAPDAGNDNSLTVCDQGAATSLFDALGGTPDAGGTWSGGLMNGIFDPTADPPGIYIYTVAGTGPCPADSASIEVHIPLLMLDSITGPSEIDQAGTYTFTAYPAFPADTAYHWTLPPGMTWDDADTLNNTASVLVSSAGIYMVCVGAYSAGCQGDTICINTDSTVGIASRAGDPNGINIYPNPSSGVFTIVPGDKGTVAYCVLNALGQEILPATTRSGQTALDLSGLASGSYLLRWHSAFSNGQQTLLIQH